jgi:hypothetical protein
VEKPLTNSEEQHWLLSLHGGLAAESLAPTVLGLFHKSLNPEKKERARARKSNGVADHSSGGKAINEFLRSSASGNLRIEDRSVFQPSNNLPHSLPQHVIN